MSASRNRFWLCCSRKGKNAAKSATPSKIATPTPIKVRSVQFKPLPLENRQDSTHFRFQVRHTVDTRYSESGKKFTISNFFTTGWQIRMDSLTYYSMLGGYFFIGTLACISFTKSSTLIR